jgi:hypothetical protein
MSKCYREVIPKGHLIQFFICIYESFFYEASVSFNEGTRIKEAKDHNEINA